MADFSKLKVTDLRAELKKRGLPQTGLKPVLVARLEDAEKEDGSESENTVQNDLTKLDTASAASPDTISPILPSPEVSAAPDVPLATTTECVELVEASLPEIVEDTSTRETPVIAETQKEPISEIQATDPGNDQSALPLVEPQEVVEDRQKRKRRSESPSLSAAEVARKRFRPSIGDDEDGGENKTSTSKEDAERVDEHNAVGTEEMDVSETLATGAGDDAAHQSGPVDTEMGDINIETAQETIREQSGPATKIEEEGAAGDFSSRQRDSRFQGLFQHEPNTDTTMADTHTLDEEPERSIAPAMHPATSALYIKDIMRPLNPANLRWHITSLAAAPGSESDPEVVLRFHIDQIRTHAFVIFTSVSAASRVRSALHDRIWPDEKTRKPLWVDFIPVDKVEDWIQMELGATATRTVGRKWEVIYDMDQDRSVTVALQDVTNLHRHNLMQKQSFSAPVPVKVVRAFSQDQPIPNRQIQSSAGPPVQAIINNYGRLDDLFSRTTAKPVLYFKPVSREIADKRLDALDSAVSKKVTPGEVLDGPIHRYTFEEDKLVDRGPEIFPGLRPPPGFRGPAFSDGYPGRNRGGRVDRGYGGARGGFGRGGFGGDSYRGSGGPGYGGGRPDRGGYGFGGGRDSYRGGQDRRYDSYRGNDSRVSGGFARR